MASLFDVNIGDLQNDAKKRKHEGAPAKGNSKGGAGSSEGQSSAQDKADAVAKLAIASAKEVQRLSREVNELKAIATVNIIVGAETQPAVLMKQAQIKYAKSVKDNKDHGLGPPDYLVCKTLLEAAAHDPDAVPELKKLASDEAAKLTNLSDFEDRCLCCKLADTFDSKTKRIEFSFGIKWRTGHDLQGLILAWLKTQDAAKMCVGKAPRSKNNRTVSSLLDELKRLGVRE